MESIWVVGASSGIGKDLALAYARAGNNVFVSARSEHSLHDLVKESEALAGNIAAIPMDVTDASSVSYGVKAISQSVVTLDKVIINAGTCEYVDDVQVDVALARRVLDTNYLGAIQVSNGAFPLLEASSNAQLVFVSSSVTYQSLPRAHAYGASKAALRYFAECLKMDAQKLGVDVRVVSPGFVKTPLTDKNDFEMPFMISSEEAAKRIVSGLKTRQFDIQFPKRFTWMLKLFSLLPNGIKFKLLGNASRYEAPSSKVSH